MSSAMFVAKLTENFYVVSNVCGQVNRQFVSSALFVAKLTDNFYVSTMWFALCLLFVQELYETRFP